MHLIGVGQRNFKLGLLGHILVLAFLAFGNSALAGFKVTQKTHPTLNCQVLLISINQLKKSPTVVRTYNLYKCDSPDCKDRENIARPENNDGDRRCPGCGRGFAASLTKDNEFASSRIFEGYIYKDQLVDEHNHRETRHLGKGIDWFCPGCKNRNQAGLLNCNSCGHPKPEPKVISTAAPTHWRRNYKTALAIGIGAAIAGTTTYALWSTPVEATLAKSTASRIISIKEKVQKTDSGWRDSAPYDAFNFRNCYQKLSHHASNASQRKSRKLAYLADTGARSSFLAQIGNGDGTSSWGGGGGGGGDSSTWSEPTKPVYKTWCTYDYYGWDQVDSVSNIAVDPTSESQMDWPTVPPRYLDSSRFRTDHKESYQWLFLYTDKKGKQKEISFLSGNANELLKHKPGDTAIIKVRNVGTVSGKPQWTSDLKVENPLDQLNTN